MTKKILFGFFMPILLLIGMFPTNQYSYAESNANIERGENLDKNIIEELYLFSEEDELISLFEDVEEDNIIYEIPTESLVLLMEIDENEENTYSLIRYTIPEEDIEIEGYVKSEFLFNEEELIKVKAQQDNEEDSEVDNESNNDKDFDEELPDNEIELDKEEEDLNEQSSEEIEEDSAESIEQPEDISTDEELVRENENQEINMTAFRSTPNNLTGVAKKSPTNIRTETSTKSKILKQLPIGTVFQHQSHTKDWNKVTVNIDGKKQTGYIHKKHFTNITTIPKDLKGVAKKSPTNIRAGASTKSKVLKQLPIGHVFEYKSFSKNWNQIKVNVNGKVETGYIHRKHLTNVSTVPKDLKGVAKKSPTNIRAGASTKSKVLKQLPIGHVFEYKSFSKNWNQIKVDVNGKEETGYIHRKHLTNVSTVPEDLKGVAKKSPTNIRAGASTKSKVLKKLPIGEVVNYKSFSKNWNEITVNVNGTNQVGYLHNKHVTNVKTKSEAAKVVTKRSPTNVRAGASTKANIIHELSPGDIIDLKTFSKNWYEFKTSNKVGYIHKKHVDDASNVTFQGIALKEITRIRTTTSTTSQQLTTVSKGTVLNYKLHNQNWYKVDISKNGKQVTGYIHKKHIEEGLSYQKGIWTQALKSPTNVRTEASTKSKVLTTFPINSFIKLKPFSQNWFQVDVTVNNQKRTGYIHKKHIENIENKTFKGVAAKTKTYIRSKTSTTSKALTTVSGGTAITYQPHTQNWYKTTVRVNGKEQVGYIHKKHVTSGNTVFLDAGHGGSDPGASGNGLTEKSLTLDIAKRVQKLLESNGFIVIMSRTTDKYLSLSERTNQANKANADIFVSIHINAGGGTGIETWKMNNGPNASKSNILASELQEEMIKETKERDRGVKDGNLHVNRESKMPSSLVEIGFIDTKSDADKLKQSSFLQKAAKGIFNGIKSYFNLVH